MAHGVCMYDDDDATGKVKKVCRCSDNRGLAVLLDSRLIIVLVVWAAALSTIILIMFVILAIDRAPPPIMRIPSYPELHHSRPDTTLSYAQSLTFQPVESAERPPSGLVRRQSSSSLSDAWIQTLRDENWILYPATATVVSHRRTYSDSDSANHDLHRELTL